MNPYKGLGFKMQVVNQAGLLPHVNQEARILSYDT